MKFALSVLVPIAGKTVVHVFNVECDRDLAWVKAHADAIAAKALPGAPYNALMVEAA